MNRILFLLILTSISAISQNSIITYEATLSENHRLFIQNNPIYKTAIEVSRDNIYVLKIKDKNTFFELEKSLANEDFKYKIASTLAGYLNPIYQNLGENKYYYLPTESPIFEREEFLISEPILNTWEIHNESKKIDNYLCYKATLKAQIVDVNKDENNFLRVLESTTTITAWFTPDIPINSGPLGYGNLPGLILELQSEDKVVFGVKSLSLNIKDVKNFSKPLAESELSKKEYKELFVRKMNKLQKRMKN